MAISESGTALHQRARTMLPTDHGVFTTYAFDAAGTTHVAMVAGDPSAATAPLVRMHSECLTGDALGSHRCDCGDQLQAALAAIADAGCGVLLYLRGHEGRGIGLGPKLEAYELQDAGLDTVDANRRLGLPDDARDYTAAAQMLEALGIARVRLLSSNPTKAAALEALGIEVIERRMLPVADRPENAGYLDTKRRRMHHDRPRAVPEVPVAAAQATGTSGPDYAAITAGAEVVAQLAQSADGFIAARSGDAAFVSGEADRAHLHRLRAAVAAVVVGAQTVVADDPQLTVRAVDGENPVRVLLDPHARIPADRQVLTDGAARTLWLVGPAAEVPADLAGHVAVVRLPQTGGAPVSPEQVLAVVREQVPGAVLIEGGGRTVSDFLVAGVLDRLFLTLAPVLIGDGVPGLRFSGSPVMAEALRVPFRRHLFDADVCTEFVLSAAAQQRTSGLLES
ncbi:GTP cyclohydrolase II [Brevibacterium luteolum]|uniref:GTP cyclohydrolase II n=1 Tax=Brevibacterium luteolum TaxID=199591 RepID=UPI00387A63FC